MFTSLIRKLLKKYNYDINKIVVPETEIEHFVRTNAWLKTLNIETVFDIGANEGQFATKILALLPNINLLCFEPIEEPFIKLKENLQKYKNVSFYPFALGDETTNIKINVNEYSPSSSFLTMTDEHKNNFDFAVDTTESIVDVKRLDDIVILVNENLLIKIDVQGFENKVIAGGIKTLAQAKILIIETSFKKLYDQQPLFDNIYRSLYDIGFHYAGSLEQLLSPVNGEILQADAIFIKH